jgi:hypothetical protein
MACSSALLLLLVDCAWELKAHRIVMMNKPQRKAAAAAKHLMEFMFPSFLVDE